MKEILTKIKEYDTILIHRHKNPDPDALGSQCGLRAILRANFPEKKIYAVGYDEPTLTYLAEMDQVELESGTKYLGIICDTANTPRIDDERWMQADYVIKIDHHPNDDAYGDLRLVEPDRSSASEIITDFALNHDLALNKEAARLLYGGIVGDTGRFLYPATSAKTLYLASKLAEFDFDRPALGREMTSFDMKVARLQGYVYENLEISENGAGRVLLSKEVLEKFNLRDAETSSIVGTPGSIRDVQSWAIFVEQADGHYRVRMRSKTVPINEIAKKHDGGGHALASGANSYSLEENEQIWQELQDNLG
ncbi:DHH family phosphoesterase [Lactococcus formosensis]|uniref:DHH family phosphoesterase n=1 Tax=Lactococcus formosensis TaxID=1281486 RepID=UPI0007CB9717|nr:bifunctional oligoribonuclease/PAP phosphatase NrnA [Lactococcus formosensis]BAV03351.1 putative bifunctional oligoribonuclease and PAP phosphatase NrnA [Lactococcus formosensis]BDW49671.1 oligoribonuclease [Lactococcus formosensis]BDX25259.1 oligoribonuclease [Lactococcus formosensis]